MATPGERLAAVPTDPEWFLHRLDLAGERALLVRLPRELIDEAAFLDERVLDGRREGFWLPLATLRELAARTPDAIPHAIFHVGHCGSTLLSRVLGRWPGALALREPLPLRTLAQAREELVAATARLDTPQWQALFDLALRLYARGGGAVVKTTSSCNTLIAPWLAHAGARALLLHVGLRNWLATILKSADARGDCLEFAPARLGYLHAALADDSLRLPALAPIERIALGWVAELARFERAAAAAPAQALRLDFDEFLADPRAQLARLARHFALADDDASIAHALAGGELARYAKATDHAYDAAARAADLAESARRFAPELAQGMAFAQSLLARYPSLAPLGPLLEH